ncbi:putative PB1 domain-containing protein [Helianthus annuus]|uniref:PB1 domain-containing protein n=1 Tax=Helianthus annuus TaxID=4232 RepID=A0A251RL96_HELAN|nr:protein NLP3 [Helianthus annuus]KAF5753792.1 putative PB1 domain-containing protein [Helianthus annuus]KAJ0811563.1 putative PB1 domain-containing protein [Helianthus annuus]KAJ0824642.1 putative PB1 domain-containing protein [Helianthus annuus]
MVRMTDMLRGKISSEPRRHAFSGESGYLTPLRVFGDGDHTITDLELRADKVDADHQNIQDLKLETNKVGPTYQKKQDKIIAALKLLSFREEHVLVQFWSPHEYGKQQLLSTIDQPFGFGVTDVGLSSYRKDSEGRSFTVDKDHEEGDGSPATRVFGLGLPEWTPDLDNCTPKHFPQQEFALSCNLHGYLALPVFDSKTQLCVGVLELLTSSKYLSYAYEVQQVHNALETVDMRSPQPFDRPSLNVPNDIRQDDSDKIYGILKKVCDIHNLPLAQTWEVSQQSSFVSHEKVIEKSCSSFDTRCVGKVCMSRAALPFHIRNLGMWPFLKACTERHLDSSHGFVGKVLLSRGSCFCGDVTKLNEEEYPLVHHARMNGLSSCFAIFLHSIEANDDYVLEFFLPPDIKDSGCVQNLVQTLKQSIEIASGFELGDSSIIQVVGPPTEVSKSLSIDPHTIHISSVTTTNNYKFDANTSDSQSIVVNIANKAESSANVSNQWQPKQKNRGDEFIRHHSNVVGASKNNKRIFDPNVSMKKMSDNVTDAAEKNNRSKQGRKPKIDSLTVEAVEKHVGKPVDEAAKNSMRTNALHNDDHPAATESTAKPKNTINNIVRYSRVAKASLVHASPKQTVANISDVKMVTVKATFKEDMIKFQFPASAGLLELEHEVARRIKLNSRRPSLKYMDEDNDLILLACDADLQHLLEFTDNHSTIKLIIVAGD